MRAYTHITHVRRANLYARVHSHTRTRMHRHAPVTEVQEPDAEMCAPEPPEEREPDAEEEEGEPDAELDGKEYYVG